MIEERISTEYQKYHNTPVDFIKSAALKIVWTLEADSQLQNKVDEDFKKTLKKDISELIDISSDKEMLKDDIFQLFLEYPEIKNVEESIFTSSDCRLKRINCFTGICENCGQRH